MGFLGGKQKLKEKKQRKRKIKNQQRKRSYPIYQGKQERKMILSSSNNVVDGSKPYIVEDRPMISRSSGDRGAFYYILFSPAVFPPLSGVVFLSFVFY